jgi:hypothetical protein
MDENPYQSPLAALQKPHKARKDWTSTALLLLVVYASTLILIMWRMVL